jgi:DNA-binding GntR family transcriptional regulator
VRVRRVGERVAIREHGHHCLLTSRRSETARRGAHDAPRARQPPHHADATPDEIDRLRIPPGTPVAEHRRIGYTEHDQPVRLMISVIPGDTIVLRDVVAT